jgi:prolyl-tRNA synthetase
LHRGHDAGRKSLQAGTSHFLGQNFAKAFDVLFTNKENKQEHVWATSWGVSTRLMGALIMTHSDDHGLVLPAETGTRASGHGAHCQERRAVGGHHGLCRSPCSWRIAGQGITVKFDNDDKRKPGWKFAEYEFKGYPVRIAIGPRDMENGTVEVARRDTLEKQVMQPWTSPRKWTPAGSHPGQPVPRKRSPCARRTPVLWTATRNSRTHRPRRLSSWPIGTARPETEERVKNETKATIRCIPLGGDGPRANAWSPEHRVQATGDLCQSLLMAKAAKTNGPDGT